AVNYYDFIDSILPIADISNAKGSRYNGEGNVYLKDFQFIITKDGTVVKTVAGNFGVISSSMNWADFSYHKGDDKGALFVDAPGTYTISYFHPNLGSKTIATFTLSDVSKPKVIAKDQPYQKPGSGRELISNTTLKNLNGWTIHEWYKPSDGKGEVIVESDGVRFKSMSGNHRIGIMQTINADVSSCSSLVLSATVKADYQTLTGTGWQGREAPVAVFMSYTDINGTVHNQLSENPNDTARRMFWHGFYYADPAPPSLTVFGTKVNKSSWHTYTVDLAALNPRPKFIQLIGAEGAGWAQRDGKIGSVSLKCTGGTVSIQQPYQPPVTTQPDTVTGQPYQPAVAAPVITVNQTAAYPGEKITVYFSGIQNPAQQDWISLYRTGAPNEKYGEWYYLKGQSGGTLTFTVPNEPGEYEFRMFLNWPSGGYKDVARSRVISIVPRGELPIVPQTTEPPQYYQPPVTSEPPQQYQPPVTSQPPTGNYPQGDVFTPQGQDDFWKGNIYERK
ncbi:MAG: hypothetical protein Q8K51_01270, partial [Nitrospirota bacterium]|nr:hypothetical protein [Nitrospirota bacterium]